MDVVLAYDRYRSDQEEAKRTGRAPTAPNLPINTLEAMIKKVRG